ncbi:substrate-binding domain-containing protein [Vibrio cholerae]|uniref:LacI family DNA-binding transcriptional regulator n=1 Tax=Vibrio cholerae TaxID=666 RepID=UPI000E0A4BB5|nr:substrate-binding domain-containing protein [Vibrio cholerae]EGR1098906.1 LacI family DNA-binding transcriptional regulator [Vibrio cholerae]MDV2361158.1 substrate-binding domain-containing protein [Vibrio cholerae]GHX74172.1 LacI family transcriptional regulator [Vibrio cholerae]HBK7260425.1 substrate-binding domain-containing protein [Vibrio cholerae]HBK7271070.1 substrate-binding domain-containing protein [Vibrio cholerae]
MSKTNKNLVASAAQVARLAGVSRSAVSRTFTQGASVSADTRQRVLAAAKTLNYHVNHLARGLSNERSRPVCLLGSNLNAPFQAKLLDALTQKLQHAGRAVMLINTSGSTEVVDAALRQTLNYRASATIVLSGTPQASLIETCVNSGQHVILVNRTGQFDGADHIALDYRRTMHDALYRLKQAGCQQLALVSSTIQSPSILNREQLFLMAAQQENIECTLYRAGPTCYQTGIETARQLLASRHRPDGVFCVTDLIACGFMDAARQEFKLNIPNDLCVIGFDNIEQAGWLSYLLTTFGQPLEEMSNAIVQRLESSVNVQDHPSNLLFAAPLIWRQSVRLSA